MPSSEDVLIDASDADLSLVERRVESRSPGWQIFVERRFLLISRERL
jgi:hypothetical protein